MCACVSVSKYARVDLRVDLHMYLVPLTKEIRLKIFDPIISNSFPVRYYGISDTNLPDIP